MAARAGAGPLPELPPPQGTLTAMGWEGASDGMREVLLREVLLRARADCAPPALYVTEHGAAYPDTPGADGVVRDPQRVAYLRAHLAARAAIAGDTRLRGYFAWSLLDTFEWRHGYAPRVGVVSVDDATRRRALKQGGRNLAAVAASNGAELERSPLSSPARWRG